MDETIIEMLYELKSEIILLRKEIYSLKKMAEPSIEIEESETEAVALDKCSSCGEYGVGLVYIDSMCRHCYDLEFEVHEPSFLSKLWSVLWLDKKDSETNNENWSNITYF